ncbi:UNVERIFIED_CONTAM: hypothetical protein Sangu_1143300 [Sesamum angustifolium]|uniref:Uncharacterized protein n=1 Tax=Sesamum angustifolium TaxID=2727405 RepID=A0AAW2NZ50_9LAMI
MQTYEYDVPRDSGTLGSCWSEFLAEGPPGAHAVTIVIYAATLRCLLFSASLEPLPFRLSA